MKQNTKAPAAEIADNLERNRITHHITLARLRVAAAIDELHNDVRTHRPHTDDRRQRAAQLLLTVYNTIKEMEVEP